MSDHLPECPMPSECHDDGGYGHSMTRDAGSPFVYCWLCDRYCICAALRRCEERIDKDWEEVMRLVEANTRIAALDAAREAVEGTRPPDHDYPDSDRKCDCPYCCDVDRALAAIDALRNEQNAAPGLDREQE